MSNRMKFGVFASRTEPVGGRSETGARTETGQTFPADEVLWGFVVRDGFDELDDPWYHRGVTQHAYLEGSDTVALCGFRPPQSGPRERRRPRLGLPTPSIHPMCGTCARKVVAPRPRVSVPVSPGRPAVAVPVGNGTAPRPVVPVQVVPSPVPVAVPQPGTGLPVASPAATQVGHRPGAPISPWVQRASPVSAEPVVRHDGGLLGRGVHVTKIED
jgi:hypothetical protein